MAVIDDVSQLKQLCERLLKESSHRLNMHIVMVDALEKIVLNNIGQPSSKIAHQTIRQINHMDAAFKHPTKGLSNDNPAIAKLGASPEP